MSDETLAPQAQPEPEATIVSVEPKPMPADPRAPIGYLIEGELGRGGMGVVYKAIAVALKRPCALKMILSGVHSTSEETQRFRTEAQAIARLQHPGIVQVFEVGTHDGKPFMALEYCAGGSLDRRLAKNPLEAREAAMLVRKLAEAVQAAHAAQVIHRDLKPGNVLLTEKGEPKLTDFGLARKLDEAGQTQSGKVMGTPSYMPPEQAQGKKDIGPAADIYALGAILYECLASRPPFRAATPMETLWQVLAEEPVAIRQLNPQIPLDLETICHKCLQKDPRKRYVSAQELADDLVRFLNNEPILARPVGFVERAVKWMGRNAVVSALAAAVLLVFAAGAVTATVFALKATAALKAAEEQRLRRAIDQLDLLTKAVPAAVPAILHDLEPDRNDILPHLQTRFEQETDQGKKQRLALALLPSDPTVREELVAHLLQVNDPAEAVVIRDVLRPHSDGLAADLWAKVDANERKFHALIALAAFDPGSVHWVKEAPSLVKALLVVNPLHLATWVDALEPIRDALYEPLSKAFRDGSDAQRLAAARVLASFLKSQPNVQRLCDLLLDADANQHAVLYPLLDAHRNEAIRRMKAELAKRIDYWQDAPLDPKWRSLPNNIRDEIEQTGIVAERWALCQSLPMERLKATTQAMDAAGYRPVSVRPRGLSQPDAQARGPDLALIWARDGREWKLESALPLDALKQRDAAHQSTNFVPADIAAYTTPEGIRHIGLWRRADAGEQVLLLSGAEGEYLSKSNDLTAEGFVPERVQTLRHANTTQYSGVWRKTKAEGRHLSWGGVDECILQAYLANGELLHDACVIPVQSPLPTSVLWAAELRQTEERMTKNPNDLDAILERGKALYKMGRDHESLEAFNEYHKRSPLSWLPSFTALVHAKAGNAPRARQDLAAYAATRPDKATLAEMTALIAIHLEESEESVTRALQTLDDAVAADANDSTMAYGAACVWARLAERQGRKRLAWAAGLISAPSPWRLLLEPSTARQKQAEDRATKLLAVALARKHDLRWANTDPNFESIRTHKGYLDVLRRAGLNRQYAAVWRRDAEVQSESLPCLPPEAHLARCRELVQQDYRPVSLSLVSLHDEKVPLATSVWLRPVATAQKATLQKRQGTAAGYLLALNEADAVWPLFRHSPDPNLRSWVVWRAGERGGDPQALIDRLLVEKDVSTRRALILALGEYNDEQLSARMREPLVKKLLAWYRDNPDPGIHAAISWLLRHKDEGATPRPLDWGQGKALDAIDSQLSRQPQLRDTNWYVNGQGQTMVLIRGPVEFRMGSPYWEPDRNAAFERPHLKRIKRNFALAATHVTKEQWERFAKDRTNADHAIAKLLAPFATRPALGMSWHQAAAYCNWLSEKEGIPKDQWCYAEVEGNMQPHEDCLHRTGYRLPTEAEWEYACRAGSAESRFFGSSISLLDRYAIHRRNSNDRTWPVGQKRPNDFGLFDMYGQAWNWCNDVGNSYPTRASTKPTTDVEQKMRIDVSSSLVLRGSSFSGVQEEPRSANRGWSLPSIRNEMNGLRVCRTHR